MNTQREKEITTTLNMDFQEALNRFSKVNVKDMEDLDDDYHKAQPFVKWVGGKRGIIEQLIAHLPSNFEDYYEPFVGGGALFYELNGKVKKAYLSDINFDLVITYNVVKKQPLALIELLKLHAKKHSEKHYYSVRSDHNNQNPLEIAARFLYLNKTGYNGLYRVNKKNEFNVPMGRYTNPNIVQEKNILECSNALTKAIIQYRSFDSIKPGAGDFVYFDPPYHPTAVNSFTKYTKLDFTENDQVRLRDFAVKLNKNGVKIMLSNSKTEFIEDIYKNRGFKIHVVEAPRTVNCKPKQRNSVEELLITNY